MRIFKALTIAVTIMLTQLAVAAGDTVALQYARLYQSDLSGSCEVCTIFSGVVEVKNIAYNKEVLVHYETGFSGGWVTQAAEYVGPSREGYEYWSFSSSQIGTTANFAVEFKANGGRYWDNNGGADYFIQTETPVMAADAVKVLLTRDQRFEARRFPDFIGVLATIHLESLGYEKEVLVRYTTDGWATWDEVAAGYNLTASNGLERWSFTLDLPLDTEELELAVSYSVNGETYWDSNLGRNYEVALPQ